VREGYQMMLISTGGTVIRMPVEGIRRAGRATQGVIVMRLRGDEQVSALAPVIGSDDEDDDVASEPLADASSGQAPDGVAEPEPADVTEPET
jgi:DNA gyrase subunit A